MARTATLATIDDLQLRIASIDQQLIDPDLPVTAVSGRLTAAPLAVREAQGATGLPALGLGCQRPRITESRFGFERAPLYPARFWTAQ